MAGSSTIQQYVMLPARGVVASERTASPAARSFLESLHTRMDLKGTLSRPKKSAVPMRVLDSIHESGAKLVELEADSVSALRAEQPGVRLVPVVYYYPQRHVVTVTSRVRPATARASATVTIKIVSKDGAKAIAGATVVAFTDFANGVGAEAKTDKSGLARLMLGSSKKIERLYVYPIRDYWSGLRKNISVKAEMTFALRPIDTGYVDALRHFYGNAADMIGNGLKVGVIDTGVGPHPDLQVVGGENTVVGEDPQDYEDNGDGHGTHVGGIIGAGGTALAGIRGVAPGVELFSYRVFGKHAKGASNFAIAKAIDRAVANGCDLINMSLGGGDPDPATEDAIADARAHGSVVFAAAGNDDRSPVSFPALHSLCIAVSAMGRKGTFPSGTTHGGAIAAPYAKDKRNFLATFSNVGTEIDLTAPGVAILSTVPGGYAAMDGTSMACPAACGMGARILHALPAILSSSRDQARSDVMVQTILQAANPLGFGAVYEGRGCL